MLPFRASQASESTPMGCVPGRQDATFTLLASVSDAPPLSIVDCSWMDSLHHTSYSLDYSHNCSYSWPLAVLHEAPSSRSGK